MQTKEMALAVLISLSLISGTAYFLVSDEETVLSEDIVVLEETYAKSLILSDEDKIKAGYIYF